MQTNAWAPDVTREISDRRRSLATAAVVTCGSVAVLAAAQVFCLVTGVKMEVLTRDPAALLGARPYTGLLSALGIGCWGGAVGLGVLGWLAFRGGDRHQREISGALRAFALLSAWLAMDDLAQFHEHSPRLLGVSELVVYLAYAALAAAWALRYRRVLLERARPPLLIAFAGFGLSILADEFGNRWFELPLVLEDGSKLVAIANWAGWAGAIVWSEVAALRPAAARRRDLEDERGLEDRSVLRAGPP